MIDDGGPAFPVTHSGGVAGIPAENTTHFGMTLRDWFAGQALAGMLTATNDAPITAYARDAYRMADAMLAARKEPTP